LFQGRRDRQLTDIQANARALEDEATEMRRISRRFGEKTEEFRAFRDQANLLQQEAVRYYNLARVVMEW
jgi:hypothetical protein